MVKKIKAVLDTNILISAAILEKSKSRIILNHGLDEKFIIVINQYIINEFKDVSNRDYIKLKYRLTSTRIERFLNNLVKNAEIPEKEYIIEKFKDKKDDPVLACGLAGEADYIITGDKELLNSKNVMGIKIISGNDFFNILKKQIK